MASSNKLNKTTLPGHVRSRTVKLNHIGPLVSKTGTHRPIDSQTSCYCKDCFIGFATIVHNHLCSYRTIIVSYKNKNS